MTSLYTYPFDTFEELEGVFNFIDVANRSEYMLDYSKYKDTSVAFAKFEEAQFKNLSLFVDFYGKLQDKLDPESEESNIIEEKAFRLFDKASSELMSGNPELTIEFPLKFEASVQLSNLDNEYILEEVNTREPSPSLESIIIETPSRYSFRKRCFICNKVCKIH